MFRTSFKQRSYQNFISHQKDVLINEEVFLYPQMSPRITSMFINLGYSHLIRGGVRRGVVVITATQFHLTKPELRSCAGSNPTRGVSEICDGENIWECSRLEIRRKRLSLINHSSKAIHHHYHHQTFAAHFPCIY